MVRDNFSRVNNVRLTFTIKVAGADLGFSRGGGEFSKSFQKFGKLC